RFRPPQCTHDGNAAAPDRVRRRSRKPGAPGATMRRTTPRGWRVAGRSRSRQARRRQGRSARPSRRPWRRAGIVAAVAVAALAVAGLAWAATSQQSSVDEGTRAIAETNAGGEVAVYTGSRHTVYHSEAPLPSPEQPRADGRPTLIWFSGTWCEFCERMEPFAHATASE